MDEVNPKQQTTSILELMYLIRAKNKEEMSFEDWRKFALQWAAGVIAEYEVEQRDAAPSVAAIQPAEGGDEGGCQSYQ